MTGSVKSLFTSHLSTLLLGGCCIPGVLTLPGVLGVWVFLTAVVKLLWSHRMVWFGVMSVDACARFISE